MIIHFSGLKNLAEPGVWEFSKLVVCMNCGFSHFKIQQPNSQHLQTVLRNTSPQV